jgi:2-dehydropantoate 2-reductase
MPHAKPGGAAMRVRVAWTTPAATFTPPEAVGAHKTSMLQDVEHGRAIELEALVGSVVELGRITATPTPTIDAVYSLASLLARNLAVQRGKLVVSPID